MTSGGESDYGAGMKTTALALVALVACGCSSARYWGKVGVTEEMKKAEPAEVRAANSAQFHKDKAECMEKGYAYQTYTAGWGTYGADGSFGGSGGAASHFNVPLFDACMQARGYEIKASSPTIFGKALW